VIGFKVWLEDRAIPMLYWKWILLGIWVLFLGFTIASIGTNLGEKEPQATLLGGTIFVLIAIVTGVGLWRLVRIG